MSLSRMCSRKKSSTPTPVSSCQRKCSFCHRDVEDTLLYGEMISKERIVAHYYCVAFYLYKLFSTDLQQRGEDNEGIEGFLLKDIRKILKNTNNIKCCYCGLPNATARCQYNRCQKIFHFFCGMHKNALSQFCGAFTSFCDKHNLNRSKNIRRYLAISTYSTNCIYCQEIITPDSDYFVTECCRSCVMHKTCLKRHALAYGYFTRCPNCNSKGRFVRSIQCNGIYVPHTDNMWDYDNEINREFQWRPKCEAEICKCPHNSTRDHNARSGHCKLCICRVCGGNAAHFKCKGTRGYSYLCSVCQPVISRQSQEQVSHINCPTNLEAQVLLVPIRLVDLRARGIVIPCRYNLRSRSSTL